MDIERKSVRKLQKLEIPHGLEKVRFREGQDPPLRWEIQKQTVIFRIVEGDDPYNDRVSRDHF